MDRSGDTVLVVDTVEAADETARRLEVSLDIECLTVSSIPAALAAVRDQSVDCVVSEYEIPDEEGMLFRGGERLHRRLREFDDDTPFILFTDVNNEAVVRQAIVEGITAFVRKHDRPAADELLAERVETALEHVWTRRRAERSRRTTEVIRDVNQALVRADTREAIERTAPAELAGELYDWAVFVAIANSTATPADVTGATRSNDANSVDSGGISSIKGTVTSVSGEDPPLSRGDALDGSIVVVDDVHVYDDPDGPLAAFADDDGRVALVPVVHRDREFGAVILSTDRRDAFDDTERGVLGELGETVGYAIQAVETRGQLQRQNERLETFTHALSHDMRNPLQVADSFLEAARGECDCDELERVARAHDRMIELVDDVLTLAHEGEAVVDLKPFDLEAIAKEAWSTVDSNGAAFDVESTDRYYGDPSRVRQILENLISNAVTHASRQSPDAGDGDEGEPTDDGTDGESVTVTVGAFDGGFYVADDGPGIPEDERDEIFEMGYTNRDGGTGYGLAIVAELAVAHDWDVGVTDSEDGGARFEVYTE